MRKKEKNFKLILKYNNEVENHDISSSSDYSRVPIPDLAAMRRSGFGLSTKDIEFRLSRRWEFRDV